MASGITLSSSVRQNLLSLQDTAALSSLTQNRLATGKKVNSALDNPGNFFTSQSLNNRASDLNSLLDSIGQAQQTLKAADQGITSVTKLVNPRSRLPSRPARLLSPARPPTRRLLSPATRRTKAWVQLLRALPLRPQSLRPIRSRSTRRAPAPSRSASPPPPPRMTISLTAAGCLLGRPRNQGHRPRECDAHLQRRRYRSPNQRRQRRLRLHDRGVGLSWPLSEHLHLRQPVR